jgi:hypothetical protein
MALKRQFTFDSCQIAAPAKLIKVGIHVDLDCFILPI